jgi:uncharacterized protein with NAD-binding domain and iron-sulfur cluster
MRPRGKKVVILGGGVAGMSAAHELVERGFEVEVYERKVIAGGKARSIDATSARRGFAGVRQATRPRAGGVGPPLPGEHGFRFFPGFYKHVVDTMARIPYRGGSVADNLVDTTELRMALFDRPSFVLPSEFPRTADDLKVDLFVVLAYLAGSVGVPLDDVLFFSGKMWQFLTSCHERRMLEYERVNWWDFIEAERRSLAYQKYFGSGITRSLVAAKARRASTKTIGDIFVQIVFEILLPGVAADRLLNGPTNDVWIDPWLGYLRRRGVAYHTNADVRSLHFAGGAVRHATIALGGRVVDVTGDYFVAALPVERMAEVLSPDLLRGDPSLANLNTLTEYVEWMNGIQFYLTEDVPIAKGHAIFLDSPWALTSVSQPQFWKDFDLTRYADGEVRGLLSVDISDWDVKGLNGREARHCTRDEIAAEVWAQLKRSLNVGGEVVLRDDRLHSWFLDPDIADADPSTPRVATNAEPLLVNYVDTWRLRPEAVTRIPNLFLASDYVRTYTDLATMEAANEAARRAVNGVLRASGADADPCTLWNLHEPEVFLPLRAYDRVRFRQGLPWIGPQLDAALGAVSPPAAAPEPGPPHAEAPKAAAAVARSSNEDALQPLRFVR